MSVDASLIDSQCAGLAGVGRVEMTDLEALAAFAAERLEGLLPLRIRSPVRGLVSRRKDLVLVIVALLDNGADLVLEVKSQPAVRARKKRSTHLGKYFLLLPLSQLRDSALEIESRFLGNTGHFKRSTKVTGGYQSCVEDGQRQP